MSKKNKKFQTKRKIWENTPKSRYKKYKLSAKNRNLNFHLTFRQANKLFIDNCFYCGKKSIIGNKINGIDRINNKKGYFLKNCVTSCKICNFLKGQLHIKDFIEQCKKIVSNHKNLQNILNHQIY